MFAADSTTLSRIEALFVSPNPKRVHVASGASIRHKVSLREPPSLAVWHDLWSSIVMPGILDDLPAGWPVAAVVEWRPGTLVYVSKTNNSLLLKGEAGGSGDNEPHVFLFQFNALDVTIDTKAAKMAQNGPNCVHGIVENVWRHLDELLSPEFSGTHVLRRAGINHMTQVTLCVAALTYGQNVNLVDQKTSLSAPFNVVLFDAKDLINLAGPSFKDTLFFRKLKMNFAK